MCDICTGWTGDKAENDLITPVPPSRRHAMGEVLCKALGNAIASRAVQLLPTLVFDRQRRLEG